MNKFNVKSDLILLINQTHQCQVTPTLEIHKANATP
ncbi:Uncharacterised protein [Yersinia aldovae]|nr:Uncharacterised protein [Yersinia aldovae]